MVPTTTKHNPTFNFCVSSNSSNIHLKAVNLIGYSWVWGKNHYLEDYTIYASHNTAYNFPKYTMEFSLLVQVEHCVWYK